MDKDLIRSKIKLDFVEVYRSAELLIISHFKISPLSILGRIRIGKHSVPIAKAVVRLLMPYRHTIKIKTITTDNGSEFAAHQLITKGLHTKNKEDVIVYFADSYASW